jgi:hypothetical protein
VLKLYVSFIGWHYETVNSLSTGSLSLSFSVLNVARLAEGQHRVLEYGAVQVRPPHKEFLLNVKESDIVEYRYSADRLLLLAIY